MGTGHHAAVSAGVRPGASVVVVGDGAVGLCAVLASRRLGAGRVVVMGRRPARVALARRFGADEVVPERGAEGIERVRELTGGGAESVCECVGTADAMEAAIGAAAPGGTVGYVGLPHNEGRVDRWRMYMQNVGLRGGVAPVRAYIPELMDDVLAGRLDPAPVLDLEIPLAEVDRGYRAMADREATKAMIRV
jgi:threonine dehydrogenase-like Zn-dependent dehydrogenase